MTLEFNKLNPQLSALGQAAAHDSLKRGEQLALASVWLGQAAQDPQALLARVYATRERKLDWHGAYPPEAPYADPLDGGVDCPPLDEPLTLVAADGSQIHPDQHAVTLYYLVNIGAIVLRAGSGQTPHVLTQPQLHYAYDELHDELGNVIPASVVDAQRDQAELRMLAELAEDAPPPVVALRDGPLLLWGYLETTRGADRRRQQNIDDYLGTLDRLRAHQVALAGYVDRSLRFDVSKMLTLSALELEQVTGPALDPGQDPLQGLLDKDVFAFLGPGQRSARLIIQSHVNKTYAGRGHEIWFFYVNVSARPGQPELARVELPAWAARDERSVQRIHAALVQQSHILEDAPYPYVLARADELAVVGAEEKTHLEQRIVRELMQHGRLGLPSRKARAKERARGGRRRHGL